MTLQPLLESADGLHLTAYLVNRGKLNDLKEQLQEAIEQATEWLNPVASVGERDKFLEPLHTLLLDTKIFKQMKGNIGIFRNQDSFRILNVPIDVEQVCLVATSFHVKPLLKWLQADQDFLFLGLERNAAHLYLGSQSNLKFVDSILFPEAFKKKEYFGGSTNLRKVKKTKQKEDETFAWLNDWISQLTKVTKPKLFVAGDNSLVASLNRSLKYKNVVKTPVENIFDKGSINDICATIRKTLKEESKDYIDKALMEFRFAEEGNRAKKNIFQISKAVIQGRVRKLIVSDELSIFGKIDKTTGGLAIHPFDLDHEDDDILDDLAQMVLSQGGEVIVASRNDIPKGRPILAILEDDGKELKKTEELYRDRTLQERLR